MTRRFVVFATGYLKIWTLQKYPGIAFVPCVYRTGVAQKRKEAVTLTEVKGALFQDYLQERDNRRYTSRCHFVYHCPCSSSQPDQCAIVIQWHLLLSSEGERMERPPLFSPWHFAKQQVASGVDSLSFPGHPPLTLPKFPGVALRSHR